MFRILSTLMVPGGGRAVIKGFDVAKEPTKLRREIGVVFQAQSIDVKLTAAENLWHQGHLYGLRGEALKARIPEMLSRVGLVDRANEKAETFSGGMQRRLELAKGPASPSRGIAARRAHHRTRSRRAPRPLAISADSARRRKSDRDCDHAPDGRGRAL